MSPRAEIRESALDLANDGLRVRSGFRVVTKDPLAGGPVELEFFVENHSSHPLKLAVSGDRMRQRPGQFTFAARFESIDLQDPMAAVPYTGGPEGIVTVSADTPWIQPLLLNQFLRLEETPKRLAPGNAGHLELNCQRPLPLATTDASALSADDAQVVAVDLGFDLRRDDAALAAMAASLFDEVMQGPPSLRERPLALLLSMRLNASAQIDVLTRHPDRSIAERARQNPR